MDEQKPENVRDGEVWVMAMTDATAGVIGRIDGPKKLTRELRNMVFSKKQPLILAEAFDYFSNLRPVPMQGPDGNPMMGIGREPIVCGFEFCLEPVPVCVEWRKLTFIEEMTPRDRDVYMNFIASSRKKNEEIRAERLGLTAPNGSISEQIKRALEGTKPGEVPHVKLDLRK